MRRIFKVDTRLLTCILSKGSYRFLPVPTTSHFLCGQAFLSLPVPPNRGLSKQLSHLPQSSLMHPSHSPQRRSFLAEEEAPQTQAPLRATSAGVTPFLRLGPITCRISSSAFCRRCFFFSNTFPGLMSCMILSTRSSKDTLRKKKMRLNDTFVFF